MLDVHSNLLDAERVVLQTVLRVHITTSVLKMAVRLIIYLIK